MDSWDRCRHTEHEMLVGVADEFGVSAEAAEALSRFAGGRAWPGPVEFDGRDMLAETCEEIADAANYVRWQMIQTPSAAPTLRPLLAQLVALYGNLECAREALSAQAV